ncbi:DUF4382 domain-containing protein [Rufibacter quisquiliarum]|uniref:DUF4382 domain-containing protein n=1 Tax=Rufibacter quisquiliarum TaxID=1549639 RepID=A0A839G8Z6_9BACT|nr:DUF4382 domain-containing protein [Rufibacter quisquiliarum]MBA9075934.1 hypothetical protein [Rufibacter quisquiliarum]
MRKVFLFGMLLFTSLGFSSCSEEDEATGAARMEVRLTDAPGDYEEVNVDIRSVQIHREANDDGSGWTTLDNIKPGVYNLLDFANGKDTLLASATLPAGRISQIRLVLGNNNTLKLKGANARIPLTTPSGQTSGVKLQINADLEADVTYVVLLDFDAAKSVVKRGNSGNYNLKPVIRTLTQAVAGGIRGTVIPAAARPGILVISAANDTIGGFTDETGRFLIKGVPAGTYKVQFTATEPYQNKEIPDVTVTNTQITELPPVDLN